MTRPIRIALQLQPQHDDYAVLRERVREAEDLGVDVIFNWDHFFPLDGDPGGKHDECSTVLAAWAEQTSRVELGALVTCSSYRHPDLLADMARTVDNISDGRLILGIGSGWFERDYTEYGYEFGAQHADIWHSFSDVDRLRHKSGVLAAHCRDVGRDPADIEVSVEVPDGDPADVAPPLLAAGATLFTIGIGEPGHDLRALTRWLAWRDAL